MDQGLASWRAKDRRKKFSKPPKGEITSADQLRTFLSNLRIELGLPAAPTASSGPLDTTRLRAVLADTLKACKMLLSEINRAGRVGWSNTQQWLDETAGSHNNPFGDSMLDFPGIKRKDVLDSILGRAQSLTVSAAAPAAAAGPEVTFPDLTKLLTDLDRQLREKYQFDVFAARVHQLRIAPGLPSALEAAVVSSRESRIDDPAGAARDAALHDKNCGEAEPKCEGDQRLVAQWQGRLCRDIAGGR